MDFFRHSHASMLVDMGVAPLEIAERLGHEKVETTLKGLAVSVYYTGHCRIQGNQG